jgi:hypothetical protein
MEVQLMNADAASAPEAGEGAGAGGRPSPAERWAQLSERQRTLLVGAAAAELTLKIAALVDIARRPADQIRGPKMLWRAAMAINLLGPLSYFLIGRKR